jgi:peptidoglycan/LPS O-acetylase OafA/YrhL
MTTPTSLNAPSPRLADHLDASSNSFGVLRLILALTVLVSHSLWFVSGDRSSDPMTAVTGFTSGEHAVQVFFLLSGLLVAHSLQKSGDLLDFAVARTLRIFPGLLVCVAVTVFIIGPLVTTRSLWAYLGDPGLTAYIAKTATLITASARLPGVFETLPLPHLVNGSLWTLKFEALCYAGLAILAATGLLMTGRRALAVGTLIAVILIASAVLPTDTTRYTMPQNLAYFAIPFSLGVLGCLLKDRIVIHGGIALALVVPAALAVGTPLQHITTGLLLGYGAIWLAIRYSFGPLRAFANRSDLSYGVYIYASPIQQSALHLLPGLSAGGLTLLATGPVLLLAALSWWLVEKPAMAARHHLVASVKRANRHARA